IHGPSRGTHAIHGVLYATPRQDAASRLAGRGAGRSVVVPGIADISPSRVNMPFCRSDVSRDCTAIPGGSEIATYVAPTRGESRNPGHPGRRWTVGVLRKSGPWMARKGWSNTPPAASCVTNFPKPLLILAK